MPQFDADRDEVVARALEAGLDAIISPGVDLESSRRAIRLAERYDQVFATVGFHPHDAQRFDDNACTELSGLCQHRKVVGIGEIGLDFYRDLSPRAAQIEAFTRQLDLAASLGLPVVVHDREAHGETLHCVKLWVDRTTGYVDRPRGVMHCFSGDLALADQYVEMGFLVSIAGPITYPKSDRLALVAGDLGLHHLLIETDAPYLSQVPFRGKRNEPGRVRLVAEAVAARRGISPRDLAEATRQNARRLFRLP